MLYTELLPEVVCETLREAGLQLRSDKVSVGERDGRWVVELPKNQIAWFPGSPGGLERLRIERKVLALLLSRCKFQAPRILYEAKDGSFDVRTKVKEALDPWSVYARVQRDGKLAERIGRAVGSILAEQHTSIVFHDVDPWLRRHVAWPQPSEWIRERVSHVIMDSNLMPDIDEVLALYDGLEVEERDWVLAHTDVGFHNLAFKRATLEVCGVFDYDSAAWVDRHHDFRYLVFDVDRWEMLEAAITEYEAAVGLKLSRWRILLYNAVCACSYLAHRIGVAPDEKCCGRTLIEDLAWTRCATKQVRNEQSDR